MRVEIAGLGSPIFGEGEGSWAIDAAAFKLFVKTLLKHFSRKSLYPPAPLMGGKGGFRMRTGDYFTVKYFTKRSVILNMISWGKRHAVIGAVYRLIHRTCTLLASSTGKPLRHAQARIRKQICGSWAFPFPFISPAPPAEGAHTGPGVFAIIAHWTWSPEMLSTIQYTGNRLRPFKQNNIFSFSSKKKSW